MPNRETIATVPVQINDAQALRTFLLKLMERLDVLLGYRGGVGIVSSEVIFGAGGLAERLTQLQKQVNNFNPNFPTGGPVNFNPTEMPEISEVYEQEEVAILAEGITEIQETLQSLLFELRDVRVIDAGMTEEG